MNDSMRTQFELLACLIQAYRETEYAQTEINNRKADEDAVLNI